MGKMGKHSRHRAHGAQEVVDLLKGLDHLIAMPTNTPKGVEDRLIKANELARKAMQFAATGVNIKDAVKRFIVELEARKDIPPKMLYGVFALVAPYDQAIATMIAGLLAARCADPDETIRRASLQQLTSLRIPSLVDVMLPPVEKLLDDPSPAVRAAAALAVLKVATLAEADIDLSRLWGRVDALMRDDASAEVVHACVAVKLHREDESVLVKDADLVVDLMLRLPEYEPHQQAALLALAKRFIPGEANTTAFGHEEPGVPQVAAFMDAVEPCLFSVFTATVLAAVDALLAWARATSNEFWYSQALQRVKKPLYALCRHPDPEVALAGLCHIWLLVQQAPYGFADDYAQFFCRHSDTTYVKQKKISILQHLATDSNQVTLVSELMEYSKDREPGTSRAAIQALAHIVLCVESAGLIETLMDLLSSGDAHLVSETVLVLKDIVRRFPDVAAPYGATIQALPLADLESAEAAAAYLWLRAEMVVQGVADPADAEPTPYVLEDFVDRWDTLAAVTKVELMFATARVALCRAPMTLPVLRKVLVRGLQDPEAAVADAARMVHGAFAAGPGIARHMLSGSFQVPPAAEDAGETLHHELMSEFNSLAVIYERPARSFVDPAAHTLRVVPADEAPDARDSGAWEHAEGDVMEESHEAQLLDVGGMEGAGTSGGGSGAAAGSSGGGDDLLAGLDGLGGAAAPQAAGTAARNPMAFDAAAVTDKGAFSEAWARLEAHTPSPARVALPLNSESAMALMTQQPRPFSGMHAALEPHNIKVFAEGPEGGFLFAQHVDTSVAVYLQYQLSQSAGQNPELSVTIHSEDSEVASAMQSLWSDTVGQYIKSL